MTLEEIQKQTERHRALTYEYKFNRKVWSREKVRKFAKIMKKSFPEFYYGETPSSVRFVFRNEAIKKQVVGMIKIATIPWHNELDYIDTSVNKKVKIKKISPFTKLFKE